MESAGGAGRRSAGGGGGAAGRLLALAEQRGIEPQNLGRRRATLEDVFLGLTRRAVRD